MESAIVRYATLDDLASVAALFDAYRQFYGQAPDLDLATDFIRARMVGRDSVILAAAHGGGLIGFCQLYPSFCSVAAAPIYVLYDLFVDAAARRTGAGRALLAEAHAHAARVGAARLDLSTAKTNVGAQALYESQGWVRDDVFLTYTLAVTGVSD